MQAVPRIKSRRFVVHFVYCTYRVPILTDCLQSGRGDPRNGTEREHNVCKTVVRMASRAERDALNLQEVRDFLSRIGLKQCTDSILNDGLYISMSLLRYATYKELLECKGITPVQAVTILTSLGATAPRMDASTVELLNAAGVDAGIDALAYAGCTSIRALRGKTLDQLVLLGLPPEQAERLCSSLTFVDDSGQSLLVSATLEPSAEDAADERSLQTGLQAFPVPAPSETPADAEVASAPARTTSAKSVAERIGLDSAFSSSDEDDRPKPWPKHEYEDDDEDDRPKDEVEDDLIGRRAKPSREKPRLKPILLVAVWLLVATLVSGGLFVYATSASGRSAPVLLLSVDTPNATEPAGATGATGGHRGKGRGKKRKGATAFASNSTEPAGATGATGGHRGKGRGKGSGRGMKRKGATASSGRRRNVTWAMERL